jgi:hypothetical protein
MSVASVLAAVGAAITFTNPPSAVGYDSPTDTMPAPAIPETVAGRAMQIDGPEEWKQGTNIDIARVRLVFEPSTAGQMPRTGATCTWAGEMWAVLRPNPVAMNGSAIGGFVDLER